jgi:uncharacterized repeat protein (TIGR03803 family)
VIDSSGNFWGTAGYGGENNKGIVWELSMTGVYKDIHDFGLLTITTSNGSSGSDGFTPSTAPSIDRNGNLFGTTAFGGAKNIGILWEITAAGDYKDLHDFGGTVTLANGGHGPDGQEPTTPVTVDSSGDLFGVATLGGPYRSQEFGDACGMVYEFTSAGVYKDLHDFGATITNSQGQQAQDGAQPSCQVALDSSGNVYGTTAYPFLVQNIWKITSTGAYIDLYDFTTSITYPDGTSGQATGFPWGAVALDKLGNIYGASARGGEFYGGNVWELLKGGSYIDLHEFGGPVTYANGTTGTDPVTPESGATLDANGNVYGTASSGGEYGTQLGQGGNVWEITPVHGFSLASTSMTGGTATMGTVTLDGPAGAGGATVALSSNSTVATVQKTLTIPAGSSSGSFTISTLPVSTVSRPTITAQAGPIVEKATLTLLPLLVSGVTVSPNPVGGGTTATGTVMLSGPAPPNGLVVTFGSSNSKIATGPPSVTVPSGATSATFLIKTYSVLNATTVTIRAVSGTSSESTTVTVEPSGISSLTIPSSLMGGASGVGTITLNGPAPTGGLTVTFGTTNSKVASAPSSLTIPTGTTSATFTVKSYAVTAATTVTIRAVQGSSSQSAQITVSP